MVAGADFLARILRERKTRVAEAQALRPEDELRRRAAASPRRDFAQALRASAHRPAVIAEMKQASPSAGRLRTAYDVPALARGYARAGAAALSVLTEEEYFLGALSHLEAARAAVDLPLLRKDFIFCPYQIWEAAAAGADAVLLIAAMLDDNSLGALLASAREACLTALCEVHDADELQRVLAAGARAVGVNNRNLRTFRVDTSLALELAPAIPAGVVRVAESGYSQPGELHAIAAAGYDAALIGEGFMRAADPGAALAELLSALARPAAPPVPATIETVS